MTPTVLLVEDNPDDEALVLRALKRLGLAADVVVAHDGLEALDWLLCRGDHAARDARVEPRVIMMDLQMPRLDGIDLLREIRADPRIAHLAVVVLTSSNERRDVRECYRLGANSYVRKPVDSVAFTAAVGQLSRYWLELNEAA